MQAVQAGQYDISSEHDIMPFGLLSSAVCFNNRLVALCNLEPEDQASGANLCLPFPFPARAPLAPM